MTDRYLFQITATLAINGAALSWPVQGFEEFSEAQWGEFLGTGRGLCDYFQAQSHLPVVAIKSIVFTLTLTVKATYDDVGVKHHGALALKNRLITQGWNPQRITADVRAGVCRIV